MLDLSVTGGQDGSWTETLGDKDTQAGVTLLKNKRDFSILKYTKKMTKTLTPIGKRIFLRKQYAPESN